MKRSILTAIALTVCLGGLAGCQSTSESITISEENAGEIIVLKTGDTLVVSLDGNPTTGFNWAVGPQDPVLLQQVGETEFRPESDLTGAPGKVLLRFEAVTPGRTLLQFDYSRSWETDETPARSFEVTVAVE
jgi:inhibitor of cysteine peptidase